MSQDITKDNTIVQKYKGSTVAYIVQEVDA